MTLIVTPPKTLEASWTGPQTATPQHKTPDCPVVIHPGRPDISGYPGHPGYVGAGGVTSATGTPLLLRLLVAGGLGALLGMLAGAIVALAVASSDRRLSSAVR